MTARKPEQSIELEERNIIEILVFKARRGNPPNIQEIKTMTARQKKIILNKFELVCERFWVAKEIWKNPNRENEANSHLVGMIEVLKTMGYDIIWDSENRYVVDIIERLESIRGDL